MQFETGVQPERGANGPWGNLDTRYEDLPTEKWYEYGFKEGVPRLLDVFDCRKVSVNRDRREDGGTRCGRSAHRVQGVLYHTDDLSRDEPFVIAVRNKPFIVVPYTFQLNDITRTAGVTAAISRVSRRLNLMRSTSSRSTSGGRCR
jgi:hypothetical protein